MRADARSVLLTLGMAAVVIAAVLALYENYEYFLFMGVFLMFLVIVYLGLSVRS